MRENNLLYAWLNVVFVFFASVVIFSWAGGLWGAVLAVLAMVVMFLVDLFIPGINPKIYWALYVAAAALALGMIAWPTSSDRHIVEGVCFLLVAELVVLTSPRMLK